jgi:hypothetical protein
MNIRRYATPDGQIIHLGRNWRRAFFAARAWPNPGYEEKIGMAPGVSYF